MHTPLQAKTVKKDAPLPSDKEQELKNGDKENIAGEHDSSKTNAADLPADDDENTPLPKSFHQFGNISLYSNSPLSLQPKLAVNSPGDQYEQEADAMADKVMGMQESVANQSSPGPTAISCKCDTCGSDMEEEEKEYEEEEKEEAGAIQKKAIQRKCARCEEEEEKNKLLRKESGSVGSNVSSRVGEVLQSGGKPLDQSTRSFMERKFGFDFGKVRVHDTSLANQSAKDINALAYTHQSNIVFGEGQYRPETDEGKWLLAHELTHVLQQQDGNIIRRAASLDFDSGESISEVPDPEKVVEDMSFEDENAMSLEVAKFIVEDDIEPKQGQMKKTDFLETLNEAVCKTVDEGLSGTPYSSDHCPYIKAAFAKHKDSSPLFIEQLIDRYAGGILGAAKNAHDLIGLMQSRVMVGVKKWLDTGDMSGVPEDIQAEIYASMGTAIKNKAKRKAREFMQFKAKEGGARQTNSTEEVLESLGKGRQLDPGTRSKMEEGFETDFSDVEIHTDPQAASLSDRMNARAFNVGKHIVFGSGEHRPGTLVGDALLAHELAHVVQQKEIKDEQQESSFNEIAYEEDANLSAISVMTGMLGKSRRWMKKVMPRLRSGLAIRSCRDDMPQEELDRLKPILDGSLRLNNGILPIVVKNRFGYDFNGARHAELNDYWLQTFNSTKVLKFPSGRTWTWEKDSETVSAGGFATLVDKRPLLDEVGAYTFSMDLEIVTKDNTRIGTITLDKRTFNVVSLRKRSDDAFADVKDESFDTYKSTLVQQLALLSPDNSPADPSQVHITSASPNPAKANPASPTNLSYQISNDSQSLEYEWLIRPVQWEGMPDAIGSIRAIEKNGVKFYDLGNNATATWPALNANIYVVVCKRAENIGQGAKRQLPDLVYVQSILTEAGLQELDEFKKYTARVESLSSNIAGDAVQIKATHVSKESSQAIQLKLFAGKKAGGTGFVLVDLTPGLDPSEHRLVYDGNNTVELKDSFKKGNKYPEGEINIEFPTNSVGLEKGGWYIETKGASIWSALSGGLGITSFLLALGAIIAAPFTEGGSLIVGGLLIGSAITGVAAGTFSIIDNLKNEQLNKTRMAIDIVGIVASIVGGAAAIRAARAGGNAVLLANSTTKFLLMGNFGLAAVSTFLISIEGVEQIDKVLNSNVSKDQKIAAITRIVANLILTGAMLYLAHKDMKAISTKINAIFGETLGKTLSDEQRFILVLLDEQTLTKIATSDKADLARLVKAIQEDPSFIQRASRHRDALLKALKGAKGDTLEHLERSLLNSRLEGIGMKADEAMKFSDVLTKTGLKSIELNLLDDAVLAKFNNPDVIRELELATSLKTGKIKGLDNWIRFNVSKATSELADAVVELREARRLANENPGSVVRVAKETDAPFRPGSKAERMPEFDIAVESASGTIERSVEVKSVNGKVTKATDLSDGIRHAASEKAGPRAQAKLPIGGELEATIEIELAVGTRKNGKDTVEISPGGTVTRRTPTGKEISEGNIFDKFTAQIPKIKDSNLLNRATIVDRTGKVLAVYENSASGWKRIK